MSKIRGNHEQKLAKAEVKHATTQRETTVMAEAAAKADIAVKTQRGQVRARVAKVVKENKLVTLVAVTRAHGMAGPLDVSMIAYEKKVGLRRPRLLRDGSARA